jgi:hypothetical protein
MARVKRAQRRSPLLIRGARALADFVFGDEDEWRAIYPLRKELGLIKIRGQLAGRPETIERQIAARERANRPTHHRSRPRRARELAAEQV